jgi:hypothetical protein
VIYFISILQFFSGHPTFPEVAYLKTMSELGKYSDDDKMITEYETTGAIRRGMGIRCSRKKAGGMQNCVPQIPSHINLD